MQPSLREVLTRAVENPEPSTVDIEAALRTGHRRRARRITAIAGVGTFVVAATVIASTVLTFTESAPGGSPTSSHAPRPTTTSDLPPRMVWPCGTPDPHLVDTARRILPQAGVWSAPTLFGSCATPVPPDPKLSHLIPTSRTMGVTVAIGGETGSIELTVAHTPTSPLHEPCSPGGDQIANGTQTCQALSAGILRLDNIISDTTGHMISAMLATSAGDDIVVRLSGCVAETPRSVAGPCLSALPYTEEQLMQVAIAIAHEL